MAHKLKDVLSSLDELYIEANKIGVQPVQLINSLPDLKEMRLTGPYFDDSMVVGREDAVAKVISMLTKSYLESELPVITILGMGGQGKTTVAQMVCKSDVVKSYFDVQIWVCVSDDFNVKRLLAEMQSPTQVNYQSTSIVDLVSKLKDKLRGKKYLLVLDDVWNEDWEEWERMMSCLLGVGGASGSKILATTRSEVVRTTMRPSECLPLGVLSEEQSWELFEKCAFAKGGPTKTPQLVEIGEKILKRCGGVPLAIKTIGGSLYSMNSEAYWSLIEKSDMWSTYSGGDKVLAAIKLSYDHLPSLSVKQCFAYCAIFEKDRVMEKDELIQLWMAQGFLNVPEGSHLQMEDLGDMYYNILLRNSLFQYATKYDYEQCCKMHDLVHDVSLHVSEQHCLHIKDCTDLSKRVDAVHVSVTVSERGQWKSLKGFLPSNLRTLYLKTTIDLPEDLFQGLECVVALIIENGDAEELPNSIGKMKLLRFLDINMTRIRKLPQWLTKLYHLQTLRIHRLAGVPKGFRNLINLRHIKVWFGRCLFKGLGQLINLQTLSYFRVGRSEDGCLIGELECLNNLRGRLCISGLENVGSYESAAKSKLSNKSNIRTLELRWGNEMDDNCDDGDVAEGLKPCSTLTDLLISGFGGSNCPSWVEKGNLGNLVKLKLVTLNKCHKLPSLGDLPSLENLEIRNLPNLRSIGQEFYGLSNVVSRGLEIIVFPALRTFSIEGMKSLMEWSSVQVTVFPNLEHLEMYELPQLSVFPNLGTFQSLTNLAVRGCKNMKISQVELQLLSFSSLCSLSLHDCEHLSAPLCSVIERCAPLENLEIMCNPESWPKDLHHLSSLKQLSIGGAPSWPQDVHEEVDCLPWPLTHSTSLTQLKLWGYGLPRVTFIPCQIQHLTTLTHIEIHNFDGLECIPDWLGNLERLQSMTLRDCKNLNKLPSVEAFQRLTNLRDLHIWWCPLLRERCKPGIGSEWPKIAHIPNLDIYSDKLYNF